MKAEEPMVFYDDLIFLWFSPNCKDRPRMIMHKKEQEPTEKSASWWFECYSALSNPIVFVAANFSDLSFSSTSHRDLKKTLVTQIRAMAF